MVVLVEVAEVAEVIQRQLLVPLPLVETVELVLE
jgi:hypothetical protein